MTTRTQDIALTIIQQLGGKQFVAMTGATNFVALDDGRGGVQFSFKGSFRVNKCRVILDERDSYTVQFWKIKKSGGCELVDETESVYGIMLQTLFTSRTGLDCTLGEVTK